MVETMVSDGDVMDFVAKLVGGVKVNIICG